MADHPRILRTVKHALFEYTDAAGIRRVALRGEQVALSDDDLARGERFGAFLGEQESLLQPVIVAAPVTPDAATVTPAAATVTTQLDDLPATSAEVAPVEPVTAESGRAQRPLQTATKTLWVDYAVSRGADRDAVEAMTKQGIIDAYPPE